MNSPKLVSIIVFVAYMLFLYLTTLIPGPQRSEIGKSTPQKKAESEKAIRFQENPGQESGRIFFARRDQEDRGWSIFSIDPKGENERLVVPFSSGMGEYNPAISPDGKTLVFNSYRWGGWKLAISSLGQNKVTRWSKGSDYFTNGVFSPDGQMILYERNARSGTDIYVQPIKGGDPRNLAPWFNSCDERVPAWSPDGKSVVFFSDKTGNQQIYSLSLKGGKPRNLSRNSNNDFAPTVSPDGTRIAYFSDRQGYLNCFLMNADGSNQTNLTTEFQGKDTKYQYGGRTFWVFKCSWSPGGDALVVNMPVGESTDLFVIHVKDGNMRRLTTTSGAEITPFWGPANHSH